MDPTIQVTPNFRSSSWLKLRIASVDNQPGVELERLMQDSCSDAGTRGWLPHDRHLKAFIEKDGGGGEISLLPATNGIYHAAPYDESCAGKTVSIRQFIPG